MGIKQEAEEKNKAEEIALRKQIELEKRQNLKKMINQINKKAELKRNKLRQQLQQVRMNIASDIGKAYKKGDLHKCKSAMESKRNRNNYCIATFSDDFAQLNYCREADDFCETCCNAEFGDMQAGERDECIRTVCPKVVEPEAEPEKSECDKKKEEAKP